MAATTEIGVEAARKTLGDLVTAAARDGSITVITKSGVPAAALVPIDFLRQLADSAHEYRQLAAEAISALGGRS